MDQLYAPWRYDYVTGKSTGREKFKNRPMKNDCVFCSHLAENLDEESLIIRRFKHCFIMMNRYPYNAGHLMVLPFEHKQGLNDVSADVRTEMMEVVNKGVVVVTEVFKAAGVNVGINLGKAGGGNIPQHLHIHIVPRWIGDTNFLATIGKTSLISSDLDKIYKDIKKKFDL